MCGACGTGLARPPWEVTVAGNSSVDRRRRAAAAERATGGRAHVRPWGVAGYVVRQPTGPTQAYATLDALTQGLLPHLRIDLPICPSCAHHAERHRLDLPELYDPQSLVVWSAFAGATSKLAIDFQSRTTLVSSILLTGAHAPEYALSLEEYLQGNGPHTHSPRGRELG